MTGNTRWLYVVIAATGLVLIIFQTLFPLEFIFDGPVFKGDRTFFMLGWGMSDGRDILLNILLFLPLGYGLAGLMTAKGNVSGLSAAGIILLTGSGLSYSIEVLQVFQPLRYPSLVDVLSNSAGSVLGYICFRGGNVFLSGYIALMFVASIPLQMQTSLGNWEKDFHLLLGNEFSGDRPWRGYISEVYITDRAVSESEAAQAFSGEFIPRPVKSSVLASYELKGSGSYRDRAGNLPDLVWYRSPGPVQEGKGVSVDRKHWLKSSSPVSFLSQRIMKTSQFTLGIKFETRGKGQAGPARIISLSDSASLRNFTLGQNRKSLIFRIRTNLTGTNGIPDMNVPGVFSSIEPKNLLVSYDGSVLKVYVDRAENVHVFELSPGAVLFSYFFPVEIDSLPLYKLCWYTLVFFPAGILIVFSRRDMKWPILVATGSILIPSLAMENILVYVSGRDVMPENLLIGTAFTAAPVILNTVVQALSEWKGDNVSGEEDRA